MRPVAALAAGVLAAALLPVPSALARPGGPARCTSSVAYRAGTDGYDTFRIPAVITTGRGTVLAFAEGRHDGSADAGDIDVVLRRSGDGGCTWGPLQVVARGDGNTRGNPAPVWDPASRSVVLVTSYNAGDATESEILQGQVPAADSRRVFVQTSRDDGRSFTAPREITASVKRPDWRWYATGPGHAVMLRGGPHAGRIVVAANHSIAPPPGSIDTGAEAKYYGGHDLYSDDHGRTWHIGYVDDNPDGVVNVNETSVTQLSDGRVYFNARDQNGTSAPTRAAAWSTDGGATLSAPFAPQPDLIGPVVQGSVLQVPGGPLLYSGPTDPSARKSETIRVSRDAGRTWSSLTELTSQPSGYSDLVTLGRHTVGVLFETGAAAYTDTITFRRLDPGGH